MSNGKRSEWVEIVVMWGDQVLSLEHVAVSELQAGRAYCLGTDAECDFVIAEKALDSARFALVHAEGDRVYVRAPSSCRSFAAEPLSDEAPLEMKSAEAVELDRVKSVRVELGELLFLVRLAPPEVAPSVALVERVDREVCTSFLSTFGVAAALFGAMAFTSPPLWASEDGDMTRERLLLISQYLEASALREEKREPAETGSDASSTGGGAPTQEATPVERAASGTAGGPKRSAEAGPSRADVLAEARSGGMIALLNAAPGALPVPWGNVPSAGQLALADAGMFGGGLGESIGMGSLGIGDGSGGPGGTGYGISGIGSGLVGPGGVGGPGGPGGWGNGSRLGGSGYKGSGVPKLRVVNVNVSGRMPPEVIQRIVRQNFGRMRMCYEQGLARNPNLEGRVEVRFLIGSDGRVTSASNGGSTLPDARVTSCVVSVFYGIGFPAPENGSVRVSYPISFVPS